MKIWFATIGEPVPIEVGFKERLHRAGMMASAFAKAGHDVIWWTSGFDHFKKRHIVSQDKEFLVAPNLRVRVLQAPGYIRNVSLARLFDHHRVEQRFLQWAKNGDDRPQVIVSSLPTVGLCQVSIKLGRLWGVPVVVDIRDLWPDIFLYVVPPILRPVLRQLMNPLVRDCQRACRDATALMGTTDELLQWGLKRARRDKSLFDMTIPFVYPEVMFPLSDVLEAERFWNEHDVKTSNKVVTFIGTLGRQFHLDSVIQCAHRMSAVDPTLRFALCGVGDNLESYRSLAQGNPAIIFPGWINAVRIKVLLKRTSVGLNPLINRFDFLAAINNKVAEYLAAGVPILSTPDKGVLARLIQQTGIGASTKEGDDLALESSLYELLSNPENLNTMKLKAKRVYDEQFNPSLLYKHLISQVSALVDNHPCQT